MCWIPLTSAQVHDERLAPAFLAHEIAPAIVGQPNAQAVLVERRDVAGVLGALVLHERVLAAWEKSFGPEDPKLGNVCHNIAYLDEKLKKYKEAEAMYKRALAIREKAAPDGADVAQSLDFLAKFYYNQGKFMSAEPYFKRDLAVKEKLVGANSPELIGILEPYADVLEQMKKINTERQVKDRLKKLRDAEKASGKSKSE